MLRAVKLDCEHGQRATVRSLKHIETTNLQLAESRDKITSLRQEVETANSRLRSTTSVGSDFLCNTMYVCIDLWSMDGCFLIIYLLTYLLSGGTVA